LRPLSTVLLLLTSSLLLAVVACGGDSDGDVVPAGEVKLASADELTSFRYDLTISIEVSEDATSPLAIDLSMELSGAVITPDREHTTVKVDFGFFAIDLETIRIGTQTWAREPAGQWAVESPGEEALPLDLSPLDITACSEFSSLQAVISGLAGTVETVNGVSAVRYDMNADQFASAFPDEAGSESDLPTDDLENITISLWVARDSGIPIRLILEGTSTGDDAGSTVKLELNLTDLNSSSIKIEAPI
jgi:hypothetical protein